MTVQRHMRVVDVNDTAATGIKVAFASRDLVQVDQHFGSAESLAIYAVDLENATLLEVVQFGNLAQDGNEDKLVSKIEVLEGCAAVYCLAAGASAVKQLLMHGVQPVKVSDGVTIEELIDMLREELATGPSAWLARAIERNKGPDPSRFDAMEAEGWDE